MPLLNAYVRVVSKEFCLVLIFSHTQHLPGSLGLGHTYVTGRSHTEVVCDAKSATSITKQGWLAFRLPISLRNCSLTDKAVMKQQAVSWLL